MKIKIKDSISKIEFVNLSKNQMWTKISNKKWDKDFNKSVTKWLFRKIANIRSNSLPMERNLDSMGHQTVNFHFMNPSTSLVNQYQIIHVNQYLNLHMLIIWIYHHQCQLTHALGWTQIPQVFPLASLMYPFSPHDVLHEFFIFQ